MDMYLFVDSLTLREIDELSTVIYEKRRIIAMKNARPLNDDEKSLVRDGHYIAAIKIHRERTSSGLYEAKAAVDAYREVWQAEQIAKTITNIT